MFTSLPTAPVHVITDVHAKREYAPRGRASKDKRIYYRPLRFSENDLAHIATIQRHLLRIQKRPKDGITFARAARTAIAEFAKMIEEGK